MMGTITLLPETTKNPITLIGRRAGVCWGADVSDDTKNYKRGMDCIESGHGRTLEFPTVEMILDGYSARVIREWYTHIGGAPTRLQASTRYINYGEFEYVTPESVKGNAKAEHGGAAGRDGDSEGGRGDASATGHDHPGSGQAQPPQPDRHVQTADVQPGVLGVPGDVRRHLQGAVGVFRGMGHDLRDTVFSQM